MKKPPQSSFLIATDSVNRDNKFTNRLPQTYVYETRFQSSWQPWQRAWYEADFTP